MTQDRDIKKKIESVKKTQQITKAMKMIAGVKFHRLEKTLYKARPYAKNIFRMANTVAYRNNAIKDKLYVKNDSKKENVLLVVVLSDKGLCGGF
ncbi:F0F1 ATP synthase subunit gamma, partial [bacterium]|nr:F0F1 ATP synthase subunit gamma [bacterium]